MPAHLAFAWKPEVAQGCWSGNPQEPLKQSIQSPLPPLVSASHTTNVPVLNFSPHFCGLSLKGHLPLLLSSSCVLTSFPLAHIKLTFLGSDILSPPLGVSHLCLSLLCSVPTPIWELVSLFIAFSYPAYFSPIFCTVGVSAFLGSGSLPPSADPGLSFWLSPSSNPVFVAALVQSPWGQG